jgi:cellulose 1,4-beta-cellobiosidase
MRWLALMLMFQTTTPVPHQSVLTWTASPTTGALYTIKRASTSAGPFTVLVSGITMLTYTDKGLAANVPFCYVVTATAPGMTESTPTTPACGTTAKDPQAQTGSAGTVTVVMQ